MSIAPDGLADRAIEIGYATAWRLVRSLPEPISRHAFQQVADLSVRRGGRSVSQFRRNLTRIAGPDRSTATIDRLVRDGMRSYARYWLETFRLPAMDVDQVLADVHAEGVENLDAAVARGRGVVVALPHSGNWDIAGLWLVRHGHRFTTVAERLKPEGLFDQFLAYREGLGMEVLALTGGPQPPLDLLKKRLAEGGVVCLVADRDLSRGGIEVDFFGERARMPAGPSLLAATTGAALLSAHLYFRGDGWGQNIGPPIDLGRGNLRAKLHTGTQALADVFAQRIAQYPQDWHMLQRLWLSDLDQARLAAVDAGPSTGVLDGHSRDSSRGS